ncbi:MAG TPA: hypothetical protein VNO14_05220 [Blastocatellia bacterium]|nr:hypothetical protein [Blastocatellia bacterium]
MNDEKMRNLSAEDHALFEVMIIEALSDGQLEDRERLRSSLILGGFDDHCARRLLRADIPEYVRASSLLRLLSAGEESPAGAAKERAAAAPEK